MKTFLLPVALLSLISAPLFADKPTPAEMLDLSYWSLSLPFDSTGSGRATTIKEKTLAGGFSDAENFYVNEAGDGVVFSSPIKGVLTSKNTTYTRSELREMGRRGNTRYDTKGVNKSYT